MPSELRNAWRAEIDVDLWEHQQDARDQGVPRATIAAEILMRILLGVPDDIGWRLEAIHARRGAAPEGRIGTMGISVGQMRWMGLCAMLGGALMAGGNLVDVALGHPARVYTSETSWRLEGAAAKLMPAVGAVLTLLCVLGVIALYVQQRGRAGKTGSAGFIVLLTGFASFIAGLVVAAIFGGSGGFGVLLNVLLIPAELFLIPLGFLLLGIGMRGPLRRVPLILGWYLVAQTVLRFVGIALRDRFPSASILYRSDSPVGIASAVLLGLGLAVIGYSIWAGTRMAEPQSNP